MKTLRESFRRSLETAMIAAAGATVFLLLRVPAGALLGGMVATSVAALAGRRLGFPDPFRAPQLLVMGVATGATITPAAMSAAATWPLSILALVVGTVVMHAFAGAVFARASGCDRTTAFFATAPGSLTSVLLLAERYGADVPRVAVAQTLRVVLLVAMAPLALGVGHLRSAPAELPSDLDGAAAWGLLIAASGAGWWLARRLHWPVPAFLGSMAGSAAVHVFGTVNVTPGPTIMTIALAGLGGIIGSRFSGLRPRDVLAYLPAGAASLTATLLVAVPAGLAAGHLAGVGGTAGLLAFAPGSMEMMIGVAIALNVHPAYVASHHVTRSLFLLMAIPLTARWRRRGGRGTEPPSDRGRLTQPR